MESRQKVVEEGKPLFGGKCVGEASDRQAAIKAQAAQAASIEQLRADLARKESALETLRREACDHLVLIEALEREAFLREEELSSLRATRADAHAQVGPLVALLRDKDEQIEKLRQEAQGTEKDHIAGGFADNITGATTNGIADNITGATTNGVADSISGATKNGVADSIPGATTNGVADSILGATTNGVVSPVPLSVAGGVENVVPVTGDSVEGAPETTPVDSDAMPAEPLQNNT